MRLDSIGRRIPKRTKKWKENIGNANRRGKWRRCKCGNDFWVFPFREKEARYCSRTCAGLAIKGREKKERQKKKIRYSGIHMWIRRYLSAKECSSCGAKGKLHRANISGKYLRDVRDWKVLCVPCHSEFDGQNKISNSENKKIIKMRDQGMTFKAIGEFYAVTRKTISKRYYRIKK
jgi:hypothetical protein